MATLDGKACYHFLQVLKSVDMTFAVLSPGQAVPDGVKVVLSTKNERSMIDHPTVICQEDLDDDPTIVKEKLLGHLLGNREDGLFVVGIDPGERVGLAIYYMNREVDSMVLGSVEETVEMVLKCLRHAPSKKCVVKIGNGNEELAEVIAQLLSKSLPGNARIELVDERGTSSLSRARPNRRGIRDEMSARIIAFRQGRAYRLPTSTD